MRFETSRFSALLALSGLLLIGGSPTRPAAAAPPAGEAAAAARALADARETIRAALTRDDDFRGSERKPAHGAAFGEWLKAVDRVLKETGGGEALGVWQRFRSLPAADRAGDPLFPAALGEYAALRYGPDVVVATQRLVRCPTVGRASESPEAARAFRRAIALVDSLCRAHQLDFSVSADSLEAGVTAGAGAPGATLAGQLDVAPARNAWSFDPWAGALQGDSLLTGRGASSKGPALAALFGLRARLDTGAPLAGQPRLVLRLDAASRPEAPAADGARGRQRLQLRIGTSFQLMALEPMVCQWLLNDLRVAHPGDWVPDHVEALVNPTAAAGKMAFVHLNNRVTQFNGENSRARISMRREGKVAIVTADGRMADAATPDEGQNAIADMVMFLQDLSNNCPSPVLWVSTFLAENIAYERTGRGLGLARKDSLGVGTSVCVTTCVTEGDSAWADLVIHHPGVMTTDEMLGEVRERLAIFNGRYRAGLNVRAVEPPRPAEDDDGARWLSAPDIPTARRRGVDETIRVEALTRAVGALAAGWDEPR